MEEKIVQVGNVELYTDSEGSGLPIIFCDGLGCDGYAFRRLRSTLSKKYKTIYWNYIGHGRSTESDNKLDYTILCFRNSLAAVMDAYGIYNAILIGYSMGSMIALDFANAYPKRVVSVVSICGSYGKPLNMFHSSLFLRIFPFIQEVMKHNPEIVKQLWGITTRMKLIHYGAAFLGTNRHLIRYNEFLPYFNHLRHMDANSFVWTLDMAQKFSIEEKLCNIGQPTLIVVAEKDSLVPVEVGKYMKEMMPNAQLFIMPDCSHAAPIEKPDILEKRIEEFLNNG